MIRAFMKRDLVRVQEIHRKFYGTEFEFSEFNSFMTSFVSVGASDNPIVAGGIRTIVEAVIVTDKDAPIGDRLDALGEWLSTAKDTTRNAGYTQLHVFIQDEKWLRHLTKTGGFQQTVGKALVIGV